MEPTAAELSGGVQAWMTAPSIAGEAKAKTTEELVAEVGVGVRATITSPRRSIYIYTGNY